jgi:hypothetical protein
LDVLYTTRNVLPPILSQARCGNGTEASAITMAIVGLRF